ncbi:MAG: hypothetical protein QXZ17_12185 [Nitrososphaerota archaeon]|jgi:hypothetical protein
MMFECDMGHRFLDADYKKYSDCPVCGGFSFPDGWETDPYWRMDMKEVEK